MIVQNVPTNMAIFEILVLVETLSETAYKPSSKTNVFLYFHFFRVENVKMQNVSVMGRVSVRGIIYSTLLDLTSFFTVKYWQHCKNALKLKLTKKYNLFVLVHFYSKLLANDVASILL